MFDYEDKSWATKFFSIYSVCFPMRFKLPAQIQLNQIPKTMESSTYPSCKIDLYIDWHTPPSFKLIT